MSLSRRALFGCLDALLFRALESATAFARLRGNPYVELSHWLHQILQLPDSDLHRLVRHFGIDMNQLLRDVAAAVSTLQAGAGSSIDFAHQLEAATERAWVLASLQMDARKVRGASLLAALTQTPELRRALLAVSPAFQRIDMDAIAGGLQALLAGSPEGTDSSQAVDGGQASALSGAGEQGTAESADSRSAMDRYCTDLTAQARAGRIDPVIGRGHEIRTMVDILLRRRQNNPLLTGEAGVGKTAVVEGLALAIAQGDVPPALADCRLLSVDVGAMLAGAGVRGEFESRLKRLLQDADASAVPIILFIDEVHTLVGAGGQAGTGDAANLLKPALARGQLRAIGATTWSEFKRHIEKDPALTRRFQVVQVLEPEESAAVAMVRGLTATFAQHHGVLVLDEAVRAAVTLSHRYIPARQLPDKAIGLLDTACARVALSLTAPPPRVQHLRQQCLALQTEVDLLLAEQSADPRDRAFGSAPDRLQTARDGLADVQYQLAAAEKRWEEEQGRVAQLLALRAEHTAAAGDGTALRHAQADLRAWQADTPWVHAQVDANVVAAVVADWTGIPVGRMVSDDVDAAMNLHDTLSARVIGQSDALDTIARRVRTARAGLTDAGKPVGVFLLAGPSGVGKTETALALADALHGGDHHLITLNMSEYQEAHTVSSLKGSPPGYVGYGEGGVLTEAVRRRPYSVVLLDEIEKAHPDVHEVFFQVFDKGWMEDGEGRQIDFKNTLILLTSNVGSELLSRAYGGPGEPPAGDAVARALDQELARVFPAAFLGRLVVVPYRPLADADLARIATLQLGRLRERLQLQHQVEFSWDAAAVQHIVSACDTADAGARRMGSYIEQQLLPALADLWLEAMRARQPPQAIHVSHVPDSGTPFSINPQQPEREPA